MKLEDFSGQKFGHVLIIGRAPNAHKNTRWFAKCEACGKDFITTSIVIKRGTLKSCRCLNKNNYKHGHAPKKGDSVSATYKTWLKIRERTLNPNDARYPRYGGKGITICDRWKDSFENFLADMGEKPEPRRLYSIDRIDNSKGYTPENCRWATKKEQMNNRSCNIMVEYKGLKGTLAQVCEQLAFPYELARCRIQYRKWPIEKVFETPSRVKNKSHTPKGSPDFSETSYIRDEVKNTCEKITCPVIEAASDLTVPKRGAQ